LGPKARCCCHSRPVDIDDIAKIAFATHAHGGYEGCAFEITGPQALSIAEIAACIGEAIDKPIHYHNVGPEDRRRALLAAGLPPFMVDARDEQAEQHRRPQSRVGRATHALIDVKPTTFAAFVRRHAGVFRGEVQEVS
jgi:uncharacterized protein YbjT (DUF2867 family)